jgi:hypothetical protein
MSPICPANSAQYAHFATAAGEMRAAIDHGYFTLRPRMSVSPPDFSVRMAQFNAGGQSEVVIFREGLALNARAFRVALFHETVHAAGWQDVVKALEVGPRRPRYEYDPDPKTYYDRVNANLFSQVASPGAGPSSQPGVAPTVSNYEKGHLYEGNVMNWYPREILRRLGQY